MTNIPQKCDVVVVGGGPAGSMASGMLSQKGYNVALLEKAQHPRPTIGESLIPHFWRFTDLLGASEQIANARFIKKGGGMALWDGVIRKADFSEFGFDRPGLHVERHVFDKILLDCSRQMGSQIFENVSAIDVSLSSGEPVTIKYKQLDTGRTGQIEAKYLVDASGQSALVARQMGFRKFDPGFNFMCLWGYYRGGQYITLDGSVYPFAQRYATPPSTLVSSIGDWGWVWHIVLPERVSVGVILPPQRMQALKAQPGTLEENFQALVADTPLIDKFLAGAEFIPGSMNIIRDYSYQPTKLALDRCYLAGDAAAFVDPINSAGVTYAMYSAYLAAWAIDSSLQQPQSADFYRTIFTDQLQGRLDLYRFLAFPGEMEADKSLKFAKKAIKLHSSKEQELMILQIALTNRYNGLIDVLNSIGISDNGLLETSRVEDVTFPQVAP